MDTTTELARLRLLQLVSPSLPIGAFTYSQGLEWAVECGWINNQDQLGEWIEDLLRTTLTRLELPLLARLYQASETRDQVALTYWTQYLIASRETRELREEERNRGRALAVLLPELGISLNEFQRSLCRSCHLTGFATAASHWQIPLSEAAAGYLWAWVESMVLAGVKIIPLGQTAGQQLILGLTEQIPEHARKALELPEEEIGATSTAQAIASSLHETQYTRIYRS